MYKSVNDYSVVPRLILISLRYEDNRDPIFQQLLKSQILNFLDLLDSAATREVSYKRHMGDALGAPDYDKL